jgi:hypothetical protein
MFVTKVLEDVKMQLFGHNKEDIEFGLKKSKKLRI